MRRGGNERLGNAADLAVAPNEEAPLAWVNTVARERVDFNLLHSEMPLESVSHVQMQPQLTICRLHGTARTNGDQSAQLKPRYIQKAKRSPSLSATPACHPSTHSVFYHKFRPSFKAHCSLLSSGTVLQTIEHDSRLTLRICRGCCLTVT